MTGNLNKYINKQTKRAKNAIKNRYGGARGMTNIMHDVNVLKKLVNAEIKMYDSVSNVTFTANSSRLAGSLIAQGDDYNQRNGNTIRFDRLWFCYHLQQNASALRTAIRIMITVDKERLGGVNTPLGTDILEFDNSSTGFSSPYNHDEMADKANRFDVLYDALHELCSTGNTGVVCREQIDISKYHQYFTGTANLESSLGRNAIDVWYMSSETTNFPTLLFRSRVTYYDN